MTDVNQTNNGQVKLRNGSTVPEIMVRVVTIAMQSLVDERQAVAIYELVMLCRNSDHQLFGNCDRTLLELALIEQAHDGTYFVHDVTRDIVLSMVEGEELDMQFVNPVAD